MSFQLAGNGGNCNTCSWIAAEGEIEADTVDRLRAYLVSERINYQPTIAFHSPGGDVAGALKLGEFMRKRRLDTTVAETAFNASGSNDHDGPGVCASACAYAFLGGVERHVPAGSRVGVHQFAANGRMGSEAEAQQTTSVLAAYMAVMGVSRDLIVPAGLLPPSGMYWLTRADLERLNVVTDRTAVAEADWELREAGGALSLRVAQLRDDGRTANYVIRCGDASTYLFAWSMELEGGDPAMAKTVSEAISGFEFLTGEQVISPPFEAQTVAKGGTVIAGAYVPRRLFGSLATAIEPASISLAMPRAAIAYVGGWGQPVPRSNLARLLPIMSRNCRA